MNYNKLIFSQKRKAAVGMLLFLIALFLISGSALVSADSVAPDWYQSQIFYQAGGTIQGWTTICNTDPSNNADDGNFTPPFECSQNVGTLDAPIDCSEEGLIQVQWRTWTEGDPDLGEGYSYDASDYTTPEDLYTINWDGNQNHCVCHGDTWFPDLGTSTDSVHDFCCGDDGNSDDWATYSGNLASSSSISCHRCLDGNDQGTTVRQGNGYYTGNLASDKSIVCYYGDITCTAGSANNGASGTYIGNGNVSGNTCYYGDISCSDGSGSNGATCILDDEHYCGDGVACASCEPYKALDSWTCLNSCTDNSDCFTGYYCSGSSCVPQISDCTPCSDDSDCATNDCNPSPNGNSYCTDSSFQCARTDCSGMSTGDVECYNNDIYQCFGEDNIAVDIDCASVASQDSDGGDYPLFPGFVNDTIDACDNTTDTCNVTFIRDTCTGIGNNITEYLNSTTSYISIEHNCSEFDSCMPGNLTFNRSFCDSLPNSYCNWEPWDRDAGAYYCSTPVGTCNVLPWNTGGDSPMGQQCCGNNISSEWLINESSSPLWAPPDSDACCNRSDKCVNNDQCFNPAPFMTNYTSDIGEGAEYPGGDVTNDREICDNGSIAGGPNSWHDADNSSAFCSVAVDPTGNALSCTGQPNCWVVEGEKSPFGGYRHGDVKMNISCCGDDQGEYFIYTGGYGACCNESYAVVYSPAPGSVNCSHTNYRVTGHVEEQKEDGSYQNSVGANVSFQDLSSAWIIEYKKTNSSGNFSARVPKGVFNIIVHKPGYQTYVSTINFSEDKNFPLIRLQLTQECRDDCSRAEYDADFGRFAYRCDADCDGINGCKYNNSVVLNDGRTMKDACDQKELDWRIQKDTTTDIVCCNIGYKTKLNKTQVLIRLSSKVKDAQSYYLGTYRYEREGKLYSAYLMLFTED